MFKGSVWQYNMITTQLSEPNQNQYTFIVPQTGKNLCHSSKRTVAFKKKTITIVKNKQNN